MRRWRWLLLPLLLLVLGFGFAEWLGWSETGARRLLQVATDRLPGRFTIGKVEGRLADRLELQQVVWVGAGLEVRVDRVDITWRPEGLLRGELDISRLVLHAPEVLVRPVSEEPLSSVTPASGPGWPELSGWLLRFRVGIRSLEISDGLYRPLAGEPLRLEAGKGRLSWRGGTLRGEGLDLSMAGGRLQGNLEVGFAPRSAKGTLTLSPRGPGWPAHLTSVGCELQLAPGKDGALANGQVLLTLDWPTQLNVQLSSPVIVHPDRLVLNQVRLQRSGISGEATGSATLTWAAPAPVVDLDLEVQKIDLQPEITVATAISGTLKGQISAHGFSGEFALANSGPTWRDLQLAGKVAGDWKGLALEGLEGRWLGGTVAGDLDVDWRQIPTISGELNGRQLDPGRWFSGWDGSLNLKVTGNLGFPRHLPVTADWQAQLSSSQLFGRAVEGRIAGRTNGADLTLDTLDLNGPGYTLNGQGRLAERLELTLAAKEIGNLVPEVGGELDWTGWVRWRTGEGWTGAGTARGKNLLWRQLHVASLTFQGAFEPELDRLQVSAELGELTQGPWHIGRLGIEGRGTPAHHDLTLKARWPDGHAVAVLAGGLTDAGWSGLLQSFSADAVQGGSWRLHSPVPIELGRQRLFWSHLEMDGLGAERLMTSGDLQLSPLSGTVAGEFNRFDVGWFKPWLAKMPLTGIASGIVDMKWDAGQLVSLGGKIDGQGGWNDGARSLTATAVGARIDWGPGGLDGQWRLELGSQGFFSGEVVSRQPVALTWPKRGTVTARWRDLDLGLANPWIKGFDLQGVSAGNGQMEWSQDGNLALKLESHSLPVVRFQGQRLELNRADLQLDFGQAGLAGEWTLTTPSQGSVHGRVTSPAPARLALPTAGEVTLTVVDLDLALLRPWLAPGIDLSGRLGATARGGWQAGGRLELTGVGSIDRGEFRWKSGKRFIVAPLNTAAFSWKWQGQQIQGTFEAELAERGKVRGTVSLPLPAQLPVGLNRNGPVLGTLEGEFHEEGLLSSLLPGLVQESQGSLHASLVMDGTWLEPRLGGQVKIQDAGAYLPGTGIHLEKIGATFRLDGQRLFMDALQVTSGKGMIEGTGVLDLRGLKPGAYQVHLKGENFRAVDLQEFQVTVSPDLELKGEGTDLNLSGTVLVPEALLRGRQGRAPVGSSPDLVFTDLAGARDQERTLHVALKIDVRLGDHVLVDAEGFDARLTGHVLVQGKDLRKLTGQGRIEVAEGSYAAYGVRLKVTRGSLLFAGGPLEEPGIDMLALRTSDEVKAGVRVTGTPRDPIVKLYSEPALADTDILAYVVLGHPLGDDPNQAGLLLTAAGTLLSQGESVGLRDRLQRQLGVDVIDVKTGKGDVSQSVVTVGKYLSPKLYISFGQSIFTNTSEVGIRYDINKHWQLESTMGSESGIDLYYKITFE